MESTPLLGRLSQPPKINKASLISTSSLNQPLSVQTDVPQGSGDQRSTELTWSSSQLMTEASKPSVLLGRSLSSNFWPPQYTVQHKLILVMVYLTISTFSITIFAGPLALALRDEAVWCPLHLPNINDYGNITSTKNQTIDEVRHYGVLEITSDDSAAYGNPDYDSNPCRFLRIFPILLGLTLEECDMCRRMMVSVFLGGAIGYERSSADRPAGIRTMGLVSLGSCVFTISSMLAFVSSPMKWDSSLVTTSLPSGIGFLGGALIWKGTFLDEYDGHERHQVHGLTTAASLWLSAAVGVGAGSALYVVTTYSTILVLIVLRYGPRLYKESPRQESQDVPDQGSQAATVTSSELVTETKPKGELDSESGIPRRRASLMAPTFRS